MRLACCFVLTIFALTAGATSGAWAGATMDDMPLPPLPPINAPAADIAPVPDLDAVAPLPPADNKPSLNVRMYRSNSFDPSDGFVPGSRYETSEDRKVIQTPGLSLSVPLK